MNTSKQHREKLIRLAVKASKQAKLLAETLAEITAELTLESSPLSQALAKHVATDTRHFAETLHGMCLTLLIAFNAARNNQK